MFALLSLLALLGWVYLALFHGRFWLPVLPASAPEPARWPSVDIIVPARDEAAALPHSLPSLLTQEYAGAWRVIVVNDHSTDGTGDIARAVAADLEKTDRLSVIDAPDLPKGWSGKVAAMHAGVAHSTADFILFTDADIAHGPQSLLHLVARAEDAKIDLTSRMVRLNCESFAEKLLIPAFVFFFAMLYPFRRAADPHSRVAAAAGGTMLMRRTMLNTIGGLGAIKSALIDDCGLAHAVKRMGGSIELTLTNEIDSLRPYPHIRDVWQMVARTAYTQLRHSPLWLAGTLAGMALLYVAPIAAFLTANTPDAIGMGLITWLLMGCLYYPTVKFYRLSPAWALTLPLSAVIYALATFDSARLYHLGKGGQWKGRAQAQGQ
ncbi:MAG: glycosyltransferase [Alphaproteobacteria bacterium]|nr:glycosyltransferase [Alphaproteobacteria bacterium]